MKRIISSLIMAVALCLNATEVKQTTTLLNENFDNVTAGSMPTGWTIENTNKDDESWKSEVLLAGNNIMAYAASSSLPADDWFFTKALQLKAGQNYRVFLSYRGTNGYSEKLEVKVGKAANSAAMNSTAIFMNDNITVWNKDVVANCSFTPTEDGDYFLGFHCFSAAANNKLIMDNIIVETYPTEPIFKASPANKNFGKVKLPSTTGTSTSTFTYENYGIGNLTITGTVLSGDNKDEFVFTDSNVYPVILTAGQTITVKAKFKPATVGLKSAVIKVQTGANELFEIPLSGEAWTTSGISENSFPESAQLLQNYPNPFNNTTVIGYQLAQASNISLTIFNAEGKQVSELASGLNVAGYHSVSFNAANLNSGIYYYVLNTGKEKLVQKLMLVK